MSLIEKIKSLSSEYLDEVIRIRRHIHARPELAFDEYQTAAYIAAKLDEYGIPYTKGIAKTGIVGLIEGKKAEGKVVALRADMDALPMHELSDVAYASQNRGVMHACGHDAHIASLLGTAKILNQLKAEFEGRVKLIFQPSEEKFPGGAFVMIEEGVLENPVPEVIVGQHVLPTLEAGKIGLRPGKYMASTDEIYITVIGKGGHAATPELNIDPVLIASHIVVSLQQIVSRKANPSIPTVLSFGRMIADGRTNIIPDEVILEGTFRTFNEEWRAKAHSLITEMANSIAVAMGAQCSIRIDKGYPFLVNDDKLTARVKDFAGEYLGTENVVDLEMRMTAEDFAYYSQRLPACFYRVGTKNPLKNEVKNLHTNTFDIDESSLETAIGTMAWVALKLISCKW